MARRAVLLGVSLRAALILICLLGGLNLLTPQPAGAQLHAHSDEVGQPVLRSLESLRDLDDRSWQLVAYREGPPGGTLKLRIVGYPGRVRLEHPTPLTVRSGRRRWQLADLTLSNPRLAADGRAAAAEFDLAPLLADLGQNRSLRLALPGVFSELPVPPFVVAEWRSLASDQPSALPSAPPGLAGS
ncbi:DUF3122 domain-containing protein [Cyanobium sp. CH-040]|uniref:DUF3122 domain-containing protein n=1 Tax=Cyanobium sp. CH-040 TaxID=2823708 RepID=UPI0020CE4532|nr:DUF3122 domain-containing protein [Cyanobium sp. CH-040]MCP9928687.1 DUF3122 domain-containing protein [Cyanobium sp. CH-040]